MDDGVGACGRERWPGAKTCGKGAGREIWRGKVESGGQGEGNDDAVGRSEQIVASPLSVR